MRVHVDIAATASGGQGPARFRLGSRTVEVVAVLDRWPGGDADHFRVAGDDGHTYVLRRGRTAEPDWEMVSFTHRDSQGTSPDVPAETTWIQ